MYTPTLSVCQSTPQLSFIQTPLLNARASFKVSRDQPPTSDAAVQRGPGPQVLGRLEGRQQRSGLVPGGGLLLAQQRFAEDGACTHQDSRILIMPSSLYYHDCDRMAVPLSNDAAYGHAPPLPLV